LTLAPGGCKFCIWNQSKPSRLSLKLNIFIMPTKAKFQKTVGLALGSGVFRGFAHIGVIKTLEKHNIPINYLSGSSIGAWAAAYYALDGNIEKLETELADKPLENLPLFFDFSLKGGLIKGRRLMVYLEKHIGHHDFSSLKIPLQIVATDLASGRPFVFSTGNLARAVRASISVPLVFKPVLYKGKMLVDGGLSNPVPVDLTRQMGADIVIGVNLYNQNEFVDRNFTMTKVALRSTRIVMHNLAMVGLQQADVAIEPDCSAFVQSSGFGKYFTRKVVSELIKIGERATEKMIPKIKNLLES